MLTHEFLVLTSIVMRGFGVLACIFSVVYLIDQKKSGWGWLIFLAIILGSYSLVDDNNCPT